MLCLDVTMPTLLVSQVFNSAWNRLSSSLCSHLYIPLSLRKDDGPSLLQFFFLAIQIYFCHKRIYKLYWLRISSCEVLLNNGNLSWKIVLYPLIITFQKQKNSSGNGRLDLLMGLAFQIWLVGFWGQNLQKMNSLQSL